MNAFTNGQAVKVVAGAYAGQAAFFNCASRKAGGEHCFISFAGINARGAQVKLSDIQPA